MDATEAGRLFFDLAGGDELSPAACEQGTRRFRDEIERLVDGLESTRRAQAELTELQDRGYQFRGQ